MTGYNVLVVTNETSPLLADNITQSLKRLVEDFLNNEEKHL
jgi:hypothetical protein